MDLSFGSTGRLRYNEAYAVLVCLECRYAVQKNAVESHLLRHKIYRGERRTLLAEIGKLHLAEPDDVVPPAGIVPPVEGLAVIPGYRCAAEVDGCEALCASAKRMRRHWSEAHGTTDLPLAAMASDTHLQTFFRGTKLKYFQVLADDATTAAAAPLRSVSADSPPPGPSTEPGDDFFQALASQQQSSVRIPLQLEMETLQYFHHFASFTALTLPTSAVDRGDGSSHWQNSVVARALQLRWLMCGVLATAATHKRAQAPDRATQDVHADRALQFQAEFLRTWPTSQDGVVDSAALEAGAQLRCIQRLCHWPSPSSITAEELDRLESWSIFANAIRGCLDPSIALLAAPYPPSSYPLVPPATSKRAAVDSRSLAAAVPNKAPPSLLKSLRELPFRMAVVLSRPDSHDDFLAVVAAIDRLLDCFVVSYATEHDGGAAAWLGMECWLREVPARFNDMLAQKVPAALIVLAHWSLLVRRTESYYWFMQGLWQKVISGILRQVPNDAAIRELVEMCQGPLLG